MKTKLLGLIIAMVAVIAVLASCGGDSGSSGNGNGEEGGNDDYDWPAGTEIVMQLGMNSSGKELSSGCKQYYSGEDMTATQNVHQSVRKRNKAAEAYAKVDVTYVYKGENDQGYGWGEAYKEIMKEVDSNSKLSPDIYVNFAYDITCASIRNCFANLLSTDSEVYTKGNHFRFVENDYNPTISEDDYFNSNAGEGYFYAYMESLSLTPETRLYCVGSNYTLDLVRAFYVIPVNVNLMSTITDVSAAPAGDKDGDGDHDIKDFYELVDDGNYGWNYEALAGYANLCKSLTSNENPNADIKDERIGFILGTGSGLTGSGVLYTTDVKILTWSDTEGKYVYPTTAGKLTDLANALAKLMEENTKSICTVSPDEARAAGYASSTEGELVGIRKKFAEDGVLFGGIICVGSLEDKAYQDMRKDGSGFGVVPVPVFQDGEKYLTSVHNIARIAAISKSSTEKSQCSAFLDYQSRHSATILEDYYTNTLTASTGGLAGKYNADMLTYIRNHVRTCFDKTFEDAIANYLEDDDKQAMQKRWHHILMKSGYAISNMDTMYTQYYEIKQENLDTIYVQWNKLPPATPKQK